MTLKSKHLSGVDSECAVSSVVEHFLDTEGVRGSNPLSRTILFEEISKVTIFPDRFLTVMSVFEVKNFT
jgi:hypothetical protein